MDRKTQLKQQYKETKPEAAVYRIVNTVNQKCFVASTPNTKTLNGKLFQLKMGSHYNRELQADWKKYGEDAFRFEILEILKPKETGYFDAAYELEKLEEKWLEKLQPYGEHGYNKPRA